MRLFSSVSCALAILSANAATSAAVEPNNTFLLKYQFKTGQTVHYEVRHEMSITTSKGEVSETAINKANTRKHYRVLSTEADGAAVLELTIDRVTMEAQFGDHPPVTYDSSKDETPPKQFLGVDRSVGKPLANITVKANGKMIKAEAVLDPETQKQVTAPSPGSADNPADPNRNFLVIFPEKPISVGETWKDRIEIPVSVTRTLKQNVTLLRQYTLESVDGDLATIRMLTTVLTPVQEPNVRAQLIQRTPQGKIVFDIKRGLIVSRDLTINKTEVGVFGGDTKMTANSKRAERWLSPAELSQSETETEKE